MRLAAVAVIATAAPLWLLVPHSPLWLVALALAICGASIPMINAPYLGMLSTRVPRALRGKVLQSLITINQLAGPARAARSPGPLFVRFGVHAIYASSPCSRRSRAPTSSSPSSAIRWDAA